jgi:hypothetical protein
MPSSIGLMYSLGILPPTILSTNSYPAPGSCGSRLMIASPYWPEPPVWRTNLPWIFSAGF